LFDDLAAALHGALQGMSVGAGMDPQAQVNPLVSKLHQNKVLAYLDDAQRAGSEVLSGAAVPEGEGYFVRPTLVLNPAESTKLTREEVFGPVVTLTRVKDADEGLRKANDSQLGLGASLWTRDLHAAMNLTPRIEAGTVWVNSHVLIDPNMPFGGFKQSGTGRDFGVDWLEAYTELKSVCINH
jgi:phenylacetaldehyde dehydrogenase